MFILKFTGILSTAIIAVFALVAIFGSSETWGDNGPYIAWEPSIMQYDSPNANVELTTSKYILGANLNDYFAAEIFYGSGLKGDKLYNTSIDLDSIYGAKAYFFLPIGRLKPFVSAGYTRTEFTISHPDSKHTDNASDTSIGFGLLGEINRHIDVRVSYNRVSDRSSSELTEYAAAFLFKF